LPAVIGEDHCNQTLEHNFFSICFVCSLGLELDRRVVVTGVNKHYSDLLHKARMREAQLSANNTKPTCFHRANDITYIPGKLGYMPGEKIFDM
jgi:hypothetical protein